MSCSDSTSFYYNAGYNSTPINDIGALSYPDRKAPDELYPHINHLSLIPTVPVRTIKKRNTANKKERRRTQSINDAFSRLRSKLPHVPSDTKLSKIKTLQLSITYLNWLLDIVYGNRDPKSQFQPELKLPNRKHRNENSYISAKGRTGWPQDVWASELVPDKN